MKDDVTAISSTMANDLSISNRRWFELSKAIRLNWEVY